MKKIVTTGLILILLALFGADFYCSRRTEAVFRTQVEKLRRSYAGILQVRLEDYHAGLLLSRARLSLGFSAGGSLRLEHQIRHFPWGVKMVTRLAGDSDLAGALAKLVPLDQLQLLTEVDLNGRSHSTLELAELHSAGEAGALSLRRLKFGCDLAPSLQRGNLWFTLAALQIDRAGRKQLALNDVELRSRFADWQGLPLGNGELRIARLLVDTGELPGLELRDVRYRSTMQPDGGAIANLAELRLAELSLAGECFTQGRLKLALRGIDPAALRELLDIVKQMQADLLSCRVDPLVLQVQLFGLCPQLFRNGLDLRLERLALHSADGGLQGNGALKLQDLNGFGATELNLDHVDAALQLEIDAGAFARGVRLLDKLQHQGRASARPAVLNELAEQLAGGLVQKGVLVRRGKSGYRLQLSIAQGRGSLNGQPFTP